MSLFFKPLNPTIPSWKDQRVWVIGASSGIGADCARQLLDQGARVMLSARRAEALNAVIDGRPNGVAAALDIRDAAALAAAASQMQARWGGIDVVLIVAGGYTEMRADSFDLDAARDMIELNLNGVFNCLAASLPILLKQASGNITIVSSVTGYSGLPKALVYGPSKAALINLAESLYFDLHPRGIGVAIVNPGFIDTPLTAGNKFPMPGLMPAPDAARALLSGLKQGDFHIHFPHSFTNWLRLARLLPYRLYFWLVQKGTGL